MVVRTLKLDLQYEVIGMKGWKPEQGWPSGERAWVNPSPNAPTSRWRAAIPAR